ncbi:MAG: hypothetical protein KIG36_03540 [Eubacteriales bacterium]|nr:hypothetical protein [Eubacteriales bacterium]
MKEYSPKNPNEYNLDGKRYIKKIRRCSCEEKRGDFYILECKIHQRGSHTYTYTPKEDYITGFGSQNKVLYLSDDAMNTVIKTISDFEEETEQARKRRSVKVPFRDCLISIYYQQSGSGDFEYYSEYSDSNKTVRKFYKHDDPLHWLLCDVSDLINKHSDNKIEIVHCSKATIKENPIYQATLEQKDELFIAILKLHYGIADDHKCSFLSKLLGHRILPSLPEEYNKDYVIESGGVDYKLLHHSGYDMRHRPYFAMQGSTHSRITLNPHTKYGIDAGKIDAEAISFQEYLKLFNKKSNT